VVARPAALLLAAGEVSCDHGATGHGLATASYGIRHPSLPDYLALTSGSTHGITSNCTSCLVSATSIVDQLEAKGLRWKAYMEGLPRPCWDGAESGGYAKKHNPFMYYDAVTAKRSRCRNVVPFRSLARDLRRGALPAYAFLTPNLCNDTHDCSVATGDTWLQNWLPLIFASPGYQAGRTALILVWDENDGSAGNQVPAIVVSPSTVPGTRSATSFTHYSLLKTTEQMLGIQTYLAHAGDAGTTSIAPAFNLLP
jgi:phosphatidylinositol-3-phosphatase